MQLYCKKKRTAVALAVVLVLAGSASVALLRDPSPVGYWRSIEARDGYDRYYAHALGILPNPVRTLDLSTSFGFVRVYEFRGRTARADATPAVLLPGRSSGTPMWSRNLSDLSDERTVYALDAIGDAGQSVQTRPITGADDQAAWIDETLDALHLARVHLVGHSFGGWTAANYATRLPARLATVSLLEPVFVFSGLRWQVYVTSLPASIPFLPAVWRRAMLRNVGGTQSIDPDDPVAAMIDAGLTGYAAKLPIPKQLTPDQLTHLDVPTYVALGGQSAMHDAQAAAAVARTTLPEATVRVWPAATHSLPMEVAGELDGELAQFMADHEP